jgi:hypothetical protein
MYKIKTNEGLVLFCCRVGTRAPFRLSAKWKFNENVKQFCKTSENFAPIFAKNIAYIIFAKMFNLLLQNFVQIMFLSYMCIF